MLLPHRDEEIRHERGEEDDVADLQPHLRREGGIVRLPQPLPGERQRQQHREEEHPLHERHHTIARNEGPEGAQISREAHAIDQQQHHAQRLRAVHRARRVDGLEDQQQHARKADRHAARLLERDRLPQEQESETHRVDRRQRAQHRAVDRGRQPDGEQETQLRHEQAQERGQHHPQEVLPGHLLLREEERQEPEQRRGADGTKREQHHRGHRARIGDVLVEDDIEPEDGIGPGGCQVACKLISFHSWPEPPASSTCRGPAAACRGRCRSRPRSRCRAASR